MAEKVELTRRALYHAIWRLPATRVAGKLGISYQKIKQACEQTNIPSLPQTIILKEQRVLSNLSLRFHLMKQKYSNLQR